MSRLTTDQLQQIAVTAKREVKAAQITRPRQLKMLEKEEQKI